MKILLGSSAAAVALLLAFAQPSHATLMLQITDGASTLPTLTDPGNTGEIMFTGALAGFAGSFDIGESKPLIGGVTQPIMDLNINEVAPSGGGGTLTFALTDTGFMGGPGILHFLSSVGGTFHGGGTLNLSTAMDCSNTPFATTTALTSQSFSGSSFSGGQDAFPTACSGPYSLTEIATLSLPAGASMSSDANLAVPEPSTIALFGAGLLGLGFAFRRKRHQASAAA